MKRIMEISVLVVLSLGASLLLCATPVLADTISDSLTVYSPSGNAVASVSAPEASEDSNHVYIIPYTGVVNEQLFGDPTVLLDPDGKVSDVFGIYEQDDNLYLAFESASGTSAPAFGTSDRIFPEGNGVFDATLYLSPGLQQDGYTATFSSDTDTVAEPSTVVMLSIGLLFVIGKAARKRHEHN
jgi:hypothetical protein